MEKKGLDAWLKDQEALWRCPNCGDMISIHTGKCYNCGNQKVNKKA